MFEAVFWQIFAGRADMDIIAFTHRLRCQNAMYATRVIASALPPCESVGRLRTISAVCTDMSR